MSVQRPGRESTRMGADSDTRAFERFENEGGTGLDVFHDWRGEHPAPALVDDGNSPAAARVVVTAGSTSGACQVHHRDIPELHADGATPHEAAANLVQDLVREIEGVADLYRRGLFGRVLDDVHAFLERTP